MSRAFDLSHQEETLSREHPISEFLRSQKDKLSDLTQEEFMEKYEEHLSRSRRADAKVDYTEGEDDGLKDSQPRPTTGHRGEEKGPNPSPKSLAGSGNIRSFARHSKLVSGSHLTKIVLKFTTVSDGVSEAPSYVVSTRGARIGRDTSNEISVPSDVRLAAKAHSTIEYSKGSFHLVDGGYDFPASIRIGVGIGLKRQWYLEVNTRFSAGNSAFHCKGFTEEGSLILEIIDGPLKGEFRTVTTEGASFGRSSENKISIPDRELSRKHSKIDFDSTVGKYFLSDMGSTNGTYMQLVGPYEGAHALYQKVIEFT